MINSTHVRNHRTSEIYQTYSVLGAHAMNIADQADSQIRRLLVPINATEESRWGIRYALRKHRQGKPVEVILLNIGEPVTQWQVLRFRTQQEVAEFQALRAQSFIADASTALAAENVPWRGLFKQGERVFSILDAAEELDCHEIVMPAPKQGLSTIFFDGVVAAVREEQRDIPVVVVNSEGDPV
jgi:hypothetical protein